MKILFTTIGVIILFITIIVYLLGRVTSPKLPRLKSDVPVEYKIGWWPYQENLDVSTLTTKVISDKLNLFNNTAIIEYLISGHTFYHHNWRPYVKSVLISERWLSLKKGDILIVPIIGVKEDENYHGEIVKFDIKIQDYLETGGWGHSTYTAKSQSQISAFELIQTK